MFSNNLKLIRLLIFSLSFFFSFNCFAQEQNTIQKQTFSQEQDSGLEQSITEKQTPIIVNGDRVEFFAQDKKVVAEGNVVVTYQDSKLTCDKITVFTETKDGIAEGNVHLYSPKGEVQGESAKYNFGTQTGTIIDAKLKVDQFYGKGDPIDKLSESKMQVKKGYFTTCDLAKPHYRIAAKQVEIYPGNKIVAKHCKFIVGNQILFYLPQWVQPLDDKRPRVTLVPGYNKEWGYYLLQAWRYYFSENAKGRLHLDYREKKDFAWGVTHNYQIVNMGKGLIRTYYMKERNIGSERIYEIPRDSVTIEKERFKVEWRHKWKIDDNTDTIFQYYRSSDSNFLEDYFRREFEKDAQTNTFFLLTRAMPNSTFSFQTAARANRFESVVERLPELSLSVTSQEIGETNLYFNNSFSYVNLTNHSARPVTVKNKTQRVDSTNTLSYQNKFAFIEARPYVGLEQTYFSRGVKDEETDIIRGIFSTGSSLSTKFYRLFEAKTSFLKLDINRLRHIITPTVSYGYIHQPTVDASKLINFDGVDTLARRNQVNFSLENKFQTKRKDKTVDLLRFIMDTDYLLFHDPEGSRFDAIRTDLELKPYDWLNFASDTSYDTRTRRLTSANIDLSMNGGDDWFVGFGQRYSRGSSNQVTTEFDYRLNPVWKFRAYERFEQLTSVLKEQEYTIYRDLHCWTVEISYNTTRGLGNNFWIVFRIKAFPEMGLEFNKTYHTRKTGSQSSTEE